MFIRRVVLKGIKGFEEADLDFSPDSHFPGWAVVTGDNSSGKTALLKAISLALLGPDQTRSLMPDLRGWVTEGRATGTVSVEIKPDHVIDKTLKGGYPVRSTFWAEVEISRDGPLFNITPADIFRKGKKVSANGPWAQPTPGWFALGYGPFRRLYGSSSDAQRIMMLPGRIPRFATLFKEDATLAEGEQWVKQLNYRRLESQERQRESSEPGGAVLDVLLQVLGDDFLSQGIAIEGVDSDGIWLTDSANRRMPLSDMSDGYRSALAMLIDIFRHMVDVYGPVDLVRATPHGSSYVTRPGVVMIDEIDSHLHPAWQRKVGFWLTKHFPSVQFIVTTHSPLVCQAADRGRIYHLPPPGSGAPYMVTQDQFNQIISGKPDQILLTPVFGLRNTRSPVAVRARTQHARLMAKRRGGGVLDESEKQELEQLQLFVNNEE